MLLLPPSTTFFEQNTRSKNNILLKEYKSIWKINQHMDVLVWENEPEIWKILIKIILPISIKLASFLTGRSNFEYSKGRHKIFFFSFWHDTTGFWIMPFSWFSKFAFPYALAIQFGAKFKPKIVIPINRFVISLMAVMIISKFKWPEKKKSKYLVSIDWPWPITNNYPFW